MNDDMISRMAVLDAVESVDWYLQIKNGEMVHGANDNDHQAWYKAEDIYKAVESVPPAQPESEERTAESAQNVPKEDLISRKAAIDFIDAGHLCNPNEPRWSENEIVNFLKSRPSAQPERTCVNCGRTVNNGGWYADGRTRCPIEEHYALPKDGYCHLWEKRNVTDDDYPERREE